MTLIIVVNLNELINNIELGVFYIYKRFSTPNLTKVEDSATFIQL